MLGKLRINSFLQVYLRFFRWNLRKQFYSNFYKFIEFSHKKFPLVHLDCDFYDIGHEGNPFWCTNSETTLIFLVSSMEVYMEDFVISSNF